MAKGSVVSAAAAVRGIDNVGWLMPRTLGALHGFNKHVRFTTLVTCVHK